MSETEPESAGSSERSQAPELKPEVEVAPSSERASERIDAWYRELDPRLGIYLTDPNVVLTLADARGQTEFFVGSPAPSDAAAFDALNAKSMPHGVRFHATPGTSASSGERSLMVNVESLNGYQLVSSRTKLPGIPRFDASTGWDGLGAWAHEAQAGILAAREGGQYAREIPPNSLLSYVYVGVAKGYPDQAVTAALTEKPPPPGEHSPMRLTDIPYAGYYDCAQPNYSYHPKDQAVVDRHAEQWGNLLRDYYQSEAHKQLAAADRFQVARQQTAR